METELTRVVGYIPRWSTCPQTVTHPRSNHLIAILPDWELNPRPFDGKSDALPLRHKAAVYLEFFAAENAPGMHGAIQVRR